MIVPTDNELAELEAELEKIEEGGGYGSPTPKKKDSTLVLFRELISATDSKKFGFLTSEELGKSKMSVRDQLDIANYFEGEGLEGLGEYFKKKAEITFASSMSKKGWFGNLIVTQIKKEQKVKEPSDKVKRTIFGKPKEEGESE